ATPAPELPGGLGVGGTNTAIAQGAPQVRTVQTPDGPAFDVTYNPANSRTLGTSAPTDFLIQSNEAINIPPRLRVFQNSRDAEARADVRTVSVGTSANEALEDIVYDSVRSRVYIANSGMNRVEVFDAKTKEFLSPIKVGQLPRSMALMPDNNTLYVANTGGESISIVDLAAGQVVGRVRFPPLPFNGTAPLMTPSVIASTQRGLLIVMSNGSIWKVIGNDAVPRDISAVIGAATVPAPRTLVSTPNGEYALLLSGSGFVYLYDTAADEFVQGRQVFPAPIQGYFGPMSAGPGGRYFLVNGTVLNPALTPIGSAGSVTVTGRPGQTTTAPRPVSAVAALNATMFVRFTQPVRITQNNPLVSEVPVVELSDANSGNAIRQVTTVEGPISTVTGTARANIAGRALAVDPAGTTAYLLTASGLSIVPLDAPVPAERPSVNANGVVNVSNLKPAIAPGTLVAVQGRNLADSASSSSGVSILGGTCVTLNNNPLPLMASSSSQITAVIPATLAAGRYPLVVRSVDNKIASAAPVTVTVSKYAPAVIVDPHTKQTAIFFEDGKPVNKQNPATRDERLMMLATGLGSTKGTPPVTDPVSVFFGDPRYKQAAVIVEHSGPAPGLIGIYHINLYVPGDRMRGDDMDITLRIGGINSPTKGPLDPRVSIR
ncbi:MAG TPA: hypothetical protein VM120_03155, partial [Bryobacteraceae bacterium]|nr:hypothetical protein [Bryobacteraceae bacterium]